MFTEALLDTVDRKESRGSRSVRRALGIFELMMARGGRCIAAVSVVVPELRIAKGDRDRLVAAVRQAGEKLSCRMGG